MSAVSFVATAAYLSERGSAAYKSLNKETSVLHMDCVQSGKKVCTKHLSLHLQQSKIVE